MFEARLPGLRGPQGPLAGQLQARGASIAWPAATVARLMRAMGLEGIIRGKPDPQSTVSDKAGADALSITLIASSMPRRRTCYGSPTYTYVATWTGFVYVAFVIDTYARRIVGWRVSRTAHASFVLDALEQALHDRRPARAGSRLVHHSDRGSQGGFKWSSQHLDGSCDEHSKTALGSFWAGALVLTRSTAGGRARGAAAILGSDCGGHGE